MAYQVEFSYDGKNYKKSAPLFNDWGYADSYAARYCDQSILAIADYRIVPVEGDATHAFIGEQLRCVAIKPE